MRFAFSIDLLRRLPRHPDWRYEFIDGEALLSPCPRPLSLRRPTALPVAGAPLDAHVRALDLPCDRAAVMALLRDCWAAEDPYRSLTESADLLDSDIGEGLATADFGAVAVAPSTGAVCAVALVYNGRADDAPLLGWLTVAGDARRRGLATALLKRILTTLHARGTHELASAVSAANVPSLRWHLSRGFQIVEHPARDARRPPEEPEVQAEGHER